ncbi:MAG TPA: hypothetical protein VG013_14520 [Gemmataceae bacterium]|jgi:hypothetical protein|nr:hypothetical protein [Gemmataceae bacterium]
MLSTEWLSAFAPVGGLRDDNLWAAFGACVFFHKPPLLWMVTARHVLKEVGPPALTVLVTRSSGEGVIVIKVGEILTTHGFSWIEDGVNDLAAAPMPASPDFGIKAVTPENCLSLRQLLPSMPCFTLGCPYGLHGLNPQRATPLVLDGVIAGVDPASRKVYTSAPTFPGNSGGPLVAVRSPFNPAGAVVGHPTVFFAGIMLETVLLPAADPASRAPALHSGYAPLVGVKSGSAADPASRIPPLHLGVAAPADAVLTLLDSDQARAITARAEALRPG